MNTIYKTKEGESILTGLYTKQLEKLEHPYESRIVETSFGKTHILVTGNPEGEPLLVFHGGNATNPFTLKLFRPLFDTYKIYAVDTIGHPGRSAQVSLSARTLDYGIWAAQVIDALKYEKMACLGISFGGGILVRLASYAPEKISKGIFIVPSGIANGSMSSMIVKAALPMFFYNLFPNRKNLVKAVSAMGVSENNEDTLEMIQATFDHVIVKQEMPRNAEIEELSRFIAPSLVIGAEKDIFFPGDKVTDRAREILPGLKSAEIIPGASHLLEKPEQLFWLNNRIHTFLEQGA